MDTNKIDKIDTNLIVPSIQENLIEIERDKWGNILNEQTFKTLNNNMKVMKEILLEIANENNVTNLDSIKLRLNNLETDRDSIESIVDNNTNGLINVGINERKLNLKGTELEFNSNKVDLDNVAYTNRENTFSENINNTKVYKLKGGTVLENIDNKIKIGNISKKLDLQTTDGTFLVNGEEFRLSSEEVKALLDTTDFQATETINGTSKLATQTEVNNGLEDTKIVTSKKLKARLDTLLAGITSTYVLKTDNATETVAGITKIATQSEINAGTDDSKLVTSKKLASMLNSKLSTYIKNTDIATDTKAGICKYGTITGTTLEGNQLAKIMGVDQSKIGDLISTPGTKVAGNVYFDTISSSYYLCLVTNTDATVTSNFANLSAISQYNRIKSYTLGGGGVWKVLEIDTKIEVTINFYGVPTFAGASALGGFEYTYELTLPFALKQGKVFAEITNDIAGIGEHISSLVYDKTSTTTVVIRFISPSNTLSNVNISVLLKGEK